MTRLVILTLTWFASGVSAGPSRAVERLAPWATSLAAVSPHAPAPSPPSPGQAGEILADEVEREDDFKASDLVLATTAEVHPPSPRPFAYQFSHPPSRPAPRTLSPRLRC